MNRAIGPLGSSGETQEPLDLRFEARAYRLIVDSVAQLMWVSAADGQILFFNEYAAGYLGQPAELHRGMGWFDAIHPDDQPAISAARTRGIERGEAYAVEGRLRNAEGRYRWQRFQVQPVATDGAVVAWIGSSQDIEDQRQREAERDALLRELAGQRVTFDAAFSQMPVGLIILEAPSGRIRLYNDEAERLLGRIYPAEDVSQYARYGGEHADGSAYVAEDYPSARALRGEVVQQHAMRYRRPDDTIVHLSVSAAPVRDRSGQIINAVCSFLDVTAQRAAELAVIEREERLRAALAGACVVIDANVAITQRLERMNLLTAALAAAATSDEIAVAVVEQGVAAIGAGSGTLALLLPDGATLALAGTMNSPDDINAAWRRFPLDADVPLAEVVRTGEPMFLSGREAIIARYPTLRDPAMRVGVSAAAALPLAWGGRTLGVMSFTFADERAFDGDLRAFLATIARQCAQALERAHLFELERQARHDAEAARADAQEANRAKSTFLAMMSHELRTPINAALGYVDLLLLGVRGALNAEQQQDLERMRRSQRSLLLLVNEVLDFARVESGKVEFHTEHLRVDELLAEVGAIVEPLAREGRLSFTVDSCGDLVVSGDRAKTGQILLNLLTNAVKFTPVGGTIHVECSETAEVARISVRDTGRGIPPRELERIFEPFVQVDQRHDSGVRNGVGLGLAIARELARGMGGQLEVTSRVGAGSVFTLTLPRVKETGAA